MIILCILFNQHISKYKHQEQLKMATLDKEATHRSAIHMCFFPSGLTSIDTYCQLKLTERYKNVSRALAYT